MQLQTMRIGNVKYFSTSKLFVICLLACSFCVSEIAAQAPYSLKLDGPKSPQPVGTEIRIEIVVTNTSKHDISLGKSPGTAAQAESQYSIQVWDRAGRRVPLTEYGAHIKDPESPQKWSREGATLKPTESFRDAMLITKLFRMDRPGTYVIQVSQKVPPKAGTQTIYSNKFVLTLKK